MREVSESPVSGPVGDIGVGDRVLVTGASGFTGSVLLRKLVASGARVAAIARPSSDLTAFRDLDIEWHRGDVYDPETVERAVQGQHYVFHLAAAFREAKSDYQNYWNVHVESTRLICEAALKNADFRRLIHVSTFGVHGHVTDPPGSEESPYAPGDDYQVTKLEGEDWLRNFAKQQPQFPYVIIRPAAIYGPGDRRLLKLFKMAVRPWFPLLGRGRCMYHLVHVDDLTNCMLIAATRPEAASEEIICGAEEAIPIAEIARIVAAYFDAKSRVVRLPITPFFWVADVCEFICKPLGVEPPIYRRRVAFYSKDREFDVGKMKRVLGYHPMHGNKAGIEETAQWYVDQGWMKPRA